MITARGRDLGVQEIRPYPEEGDEQLLRRSPEVDRRPLGLGAIAAVCAIALLGNLAVWLLLRDSEPSVLVSQCRDPAGPRATRWRKGTGLQPGAFGAGS